MIGCVILQLVCLNLEEKSRNRLLGNIFNIKNVSVSELLSIDNKFIFRLFDGNVFYHYSIIVDKGDDISFKEFNIERYTIYVYNNNRKRSDKIVYQLLKCENEFQVYDLIKHLL